MVKGMASTNSDSQFQVSERAPLVLVSGPRSVGKSSFVCALWGDSELLPTAERDCTQVNTLVCAPGGGQDEDRVRVVYLPRDRAYAFAVRDLSYHRLATFLMETLGPLGPNLEAFPPEDRLHKVIEAMRDLFRKRPDLLVLHDHLNDQIDRLEEFLAFVASPTYQAGETVTMDWRERREQLMGQRRPDGRPIGIGRMLAVERVELVRGTHVWPKTPPQLMDTPWVPTFHNARRAELLLEEAREAHALMLVARAGPFALQGWVEQLLDKRKELAARTLVIFNQVDTVDMSRLLARDGFSAAFDESMRTLGAVGIPVENVFVSCTRLPFLNKSASAEQHAKRIARLREVLGTLRKRLASAPENAAPLLKPRLLRATESDGGIEAVRERLMSFLP